MILPLRPRSLVMPSATVAARCLPSPLQRVAGGSGFLARGVVDVVLHVWPARERLRDPPGSPILAMDDPDRYPRRAASSAPRSLIGRLSPLEGRLRMFLGTPRRWWIAAAVPLVLGFVLLATGDGTMLRTAAAVLLLLLAMVLFGMAPMRYGQSARTAPDRTAETPPTTPTVPIATIDPPRPRALIEGRDPSEV